MHLQIENMIIRKEERKKLRVLTSGRFKSASALLKSTVALSVAESEARIIAMSKADTASTARPRADRIIPNRQVADKRYRGISNASGRKEDVLSLQI